MYTLRTTKIFDRKLKNLQTIFGLTDSQTREIIAEIKELMIELQETGTVPAQYQDHLLKREPWIGYHEFHVLDDLLVIYFKIESKSVIRMVTITNHEELRTGKFI